MQIIRKTNIPDISAKITKNERKDGKTILTGYLFNHVTGIRVTGKSDKKYTFNTKDKDSETEIIYFVNRMVNQQFKAAPASPRTGPTSNSSGIFSAAFGALNIADMRASFPWADSTFRKSYTYTQSVLTEMDKYGLDIVSEDMETIKEHFIQKAMKNGRGNRRRADAEKHVTDELKRVERMLIYMYKLNPDLPARLFTFTTVDTVIPEQARALPNEIRVKLVYLLLKNISNGLMMGIAVMFFLGLRTAEACAMCIGDIVDYIEYIVYPVQYQISNGVRTDALKTGNAYRYTISNMVMRYIYIQRIQYLRSLKYSDDQIRKMPFVSSKTDPEKYANPSVVAKFARSILLACGCTEELLASAKMLMDLEPDKSPDGIIETHVTAYLLRRDWASRASNICGLSSSDVDYLIGHSSAADPIKDYANEDVQRDISMMLERYVVCPELSRHPYFRGLEIAPGVKMEQMGFNRYRLTATKPTLVYLDAISKERRQRILVKTNGKANDNFSLVNGGKDTPDDRLNRPIIGIVYPELYYHTLCDEATLINVQEIKGELE